MIFKNMTQADAVLAIVDRLLRDDETRIYCTPYKNGRENGWNLSANNTDNKMVSFSEYRNTDSIVVYTGGYINFSAQGNVPDDETYASKTFFAYNEYWEAARFITKYLTGEDY